MKDSASSLLSPENRLTLDHLGCRHCLRHRSEGRREGREVECVCVCVCVCDMRIYRRYEI